MSIGELKMNKRIILILCLICLVFLSITAISASDNLTNSDLTTSIAENNDVESVTEDYSLHYQANDSLDVQSKANDESNISDNSISLDSDFAYENTVSVCSEDKFGLDNSGEIQSRNIDDTPVLKATTATVKKPAYLTAFKWVATTKSFTILKVKVLDNNGILVKEGDVRFGINGKFYKVRVVGGVATKKIILTRSGAYTYAAYFTSKNYKNAIKHSKAYVKPAKNVYVFKLGKFSAKLNYKQYLDLLKAKNNNYYNYIQVKVSNNYLYKQPVYKSMTVKKTKWVYKEVLSYKSVSSEDWSETDYYDYPLDKYFDAGWDICGSRSVEADHGHVYAYYTKLKKLVTYTETKWHVASYKTLKCPFYITVETLPKDALIEKGDYINGWIDTGIDMGEFGGSVKIDLFTYNP